MKIELNESRLTLLNKIMIETFNQLAREGIGRNCLNCGVWDHSKELCMHINPKKHGKRPPAYVIAYGCEEYVDTIPF